MLNIGTVAVSAAMLAGRAAHMHARGTALLLRSRASSNVPRVPSSVRLTSMMERLNTLLADASKWASSVRPATVQASPPSPTSGEHGSGAYLLRRSRSKDEDGSAPQALGVLDRVYANTHFSMEDIDVVGFDFDHTMVSYKKELNRRIYQLALERLLSDAHGYPAAMASACAGFDHRTVTRGLSVDRETGALIKLSSEAALAVSTHAALRAFQASKQRIHSVMPCAWPTAAPPLDSRDRRSVQSHRQGQARARVARIRRDRAPLRGGRGPPVPGAQRPARAAE